MICLQKLVYKIIRRVGCFNNFYNYVFMTKFNKKREKNILFILSGTGYFDMPAYQKYNEKQIVDYKVSDDELKKLSLSLPIVK